MSLTREGGTTKRGALMVVRMCGEVGVGGRGCRVRQARDWAACAGVCWRVGGRGSNGGGEL